MALSDVLGSIPFIGGMEASRQLTGQRQAEALRQRVTLAQLMQQQQEMAMKQKDAAEMETIKGVVAQAGGNPEKAIQALLSTGNPKAIELAAKLKDFRTKPEESPFAKPQAKDYTPESRAKFMQSRNPADLVPVPETPKQETNPEVVKLGNLLQTLPAGHPMRQSIEARIKLLTTREPGVTVNMPPSSETVYNPEDKKYYRFQVGKDGKTRAVPIQLDSGTPLEPPPPKNPKEEGLTPENAAKVAMSQQAITGISTARGKIFDKDGNLNRSLVLATTANMPLNSDARIARSALRNAVEAKLRIETGAAATESEVQRTIDRFMPNVADTKESAKFKLDELESFFKSSLSQTKGIPKPKTEATKKRLKFDANGNPVP